MFVLGLDVGVGAEIHLCDRSHDILVVKDLLDANCRVDVVERHDYAREGFEGCPCVDWGCGVDEVFYGEEVWRGEDLFGGEVGDDECEA